MTEPATAPVSIDFDVPYCIGCKHYLESSTGPSFGKCGYVETRNVVSGEMDNWYCAVMRRGRESWDTDASMALRCEIHGKFFEPKPFVEVPPPPVQIEHSPSMPADMRGTTERVRRQVAVVARRQKPSLLTRIFGV